ncbi:hypothetical protein GCM10020000_47670 [Streptomyces olivoverticillatus]
MEDGAGELREARHIGDRRVGQRPGGRDHDVGGVLAGAGAHLPVQLARVPAQALHLGAEAQVRPQPEDVGDVLHVGPDVRLAGEGAGPGGVGGAKEKE